GGLPFLRGVVDALGDLPAHPLHQLAAERPGGGRGGFASGRLSARRAFRPRGVPEPPVARARHRAGQTAWTVPVHWVFSPVARGGCARAAVALGRARRPRGRGPPPPGAGHLKGWGLVESPHGSLGDDGATDP